MFEVLHEVHGKELKPDEACITVYICAIVGVGVKVGVSSA